MEVRKGRRDSGLERRFIFLTGGVVSSLGKGLTAATLGALLKARGFRVRLRKLDPYLNVDPGTMSPYQHGEVFVTQDGAETDLDLGHYERFTGTPTAASDNITAGQVYSSVIAAERRGAYLGSTVQVIPHITDEIKSRIRSDLSDEDFVICETGGTVGDMECLPFLEALRQMGNALGRSRSLFVHCTLMPYLPASGELKTKPTQHSVKELLSLGIQPQILVCRSSHGLQEAQRSKLSLFCNLRREDVIEAPDAKSIYSVPRIYHDNGLDASVCRHFGLERSPSPDLSEWDRIAECVRRPQATVQIGVVAKYEALQDAYISLSEALVHAGIALRTEVRVRWIAAEDLPEEKNDAQLQGLHGILVPGGFGERGIEGKISAIRYARLRRAPFLGICLGMQLMVVEFARNVLDLRGAGSNEFGSCAEPVVGLLEEWVKGFSTERRSSSQDLGGSMRLGEYPCMLQEGSCVQGMYERTRISERHRHRYEINLRYKEALEMHGLWFSGMSPDGLLMETVELRGHPWFVGVQFHPELKSRPFDPHPLFIGFLRAALQART